MQEQYHLLSLSSAFPLMATQSTSSIKPIRKNISHWCKCGAQPPHKRRSASHCLYNKARVSAAGEEDDRPPMQRYTINIGLRSFLKYPIMIDAIKEAVERSSIIRYEATKLAQLYVIMNVNNVNAIMSVAQGRDPFSRQFYIDCYHAVSRLDNQAQPRVTTYLLQAWNTYNTIRGNLPWTSRSGLTQVLSFASNEDATTAATNVFVHFKTRLTRFIWLQLAAGVDGLMNLVNYNGVKKIASAMVDTLWQDDDEDGDVDMDWVIYEDAAALWQQLSASMEIVASNQQQ